VHDDRDRDLFSQRAERWQEPRPRFVSAPTTGSIHHDASQHPAMVDTHATAVL